MAVNSFADKLVKKIFGSSSDIFLKNVKPVVTQIQDWEAKVEKLTDEELQAQTPKFKEMIARAIEGIEDKEARRKAEQEVLNQILPEAFATVREGSRRVTGMRHFDVQMIGGIALHQGRIAEMRTGEGKTLVATLPSYLNGLTGRGVHVVTVNDYLASRDAEWMGKIHTFLGLKVGCIQNDMDDIERKEAYACDITYGTNNEFGFDYLRDNMKFDVDSLVQPDHYFAIIDEVDSILIDEARTPLIISGASDEATDKYFTANEIIPKLERGHKDEETKVTTGDYLLDEKNHSSVLTEAGVLKAERLLGVSNLYDPGNMDLLHCVEQALKAHTLYKADHHYVVQEGEVIIVDDFTGRLMQGRRWSDGLHQAVEAKEGVKIERENQTLATITLQNYFRMYEKLGGMTGTAETEAEEFGSVYGLDVVMIPTNQPMVRKDTPDVIYRTLSEKWDAVVEEIKDLHAEGRPVLVGTVSVENSELVAGKLKAIGVPHKVLNAKYHEQEAEIIAQAGRKGAVTIATNMAGRGTDILLGGNPDELARDYLKHLEINPDEATEEQFEEQLKKAKAVVKEEHNAVVQAGGLHILGTERHESRRIDNQLRGRAGRQGDPGSSRFVLSLEDDLMRIFAGDKVRSMMEWLGMEKGVAIESKTVSKQIERAQKAVEARNFETRKHVLKYDDVMNRQRETIYSLRRQLMFEPEHREYLLGENGVARDLLSDLTHSFLAATVTPDKWDISTYAAEIESIYAIDPAVDANVDFKTMNAVQIEQAIWEKAAASYAEKEKQAGGESLRAYERYIMLNIIDSQWKDHLLSIDHVKQGIGLVGYGQKDPLVEYKKQSFDMFQDMLDRIDTNTTKALFNLEIVQRDEQEEIERLERLEMQRARRQAAGMAFTGAMSTAEAAGAEAARHTPFVRDSPKMKPNDPCHCGSGKKFKKCHGAGA
ncbi:MAG: preprotein translocase subunit SecA [Chloracidobacterium sp.]|nr:preprotein translocase subunit SecA [Chloracidobacterium sp.]MBK7803297.1 preprotein translocase subunit SecA [Chloracidobacterium sp.]MBK9438550.1 preprotein translocase subunit SecA [Chloracidobacterium sp.]MBL0241075.1 preprotein translocase subunit SecA [Chloracidobacterium sp.]MBP9934873.1 preprotein translocase subunit SecA [Pyrinomonadaceae bacterium]